MQSQKDCTYSALCILITFRWCTLYSAYRT